MDALDATIQQITVALTNLRNGVPVQTLCLPGQPPRTVTTADINSLRSDLMRCEWRRFNRSDRGLSP